MTAMTEAETPPPAELAEIPRRKRPQPYQRSRYHIRSRRRTASTGGHAGKRARAGAGSSGRRSAGKAGRNGSGRTVAQSGSACASLWQQSRSQRESARAGRARNSRFRRGLFHHRRAVGRLRHRLREPQRPSCRRRRRHRHGAPGHSRPQRRSAGDRCAGAFALRRAAPADRRGRSGRAPHRRSARHRCRRVARAALVEARFRLAQARDHAGAAARDLSPGPAGHRLPERE